MKQEVESALREGLTQCMSSPVNRLEVRRQIVRPYSQVSFCHVGFASGAALECVAKLVTGPARDMARQQVLMARDFIVNKHLHDTLPRQGHHTVPTPLLFRPELNLIVTEFMPGLRLQDQLISAGRGWPSAATMDRLEGACSSCGEWLRLFQQVTAGFVANSSEFGRGLDAVDATTCVEQVSICLESLELAGESPFTARESQELLDFVAERSRSIENEDTRVVGVHGDYFAGNVLNDGARTIGIDFVMFRKGLRLVDPSYFVLQLETLRLVPGIRSATVRRLAGAFLRGFDPQINADQFWTTNATTDVLYVLHRVRRLWGMSGARVAPHRALLRRLQSAWTANRLLRHVRRSTDACTRGEP